MFCRDMPPHDEENGRADEAELNGAGKQEGRTVLNQLGRNVKQQQAKSQEEAGLPCGAQVEFDSVSL